MRLRRVAGCRLWVVGKDAGYAGMFFVRFLVSALEWKRGNEIGRRERRARCGTPAAGCGLWGFLWLFCHPERSESSSAVEGPCGRVPASLTRLTFHTAVPSRRLYRKASEYPSTRSFDCARRLAPLRMTDEEMDAVVIPHNPQLTTRNAPQAHRNPQHGSAARNAPQAHRNPQPHEKQLTTFPFAR